MLSFDAAVFAWAGLAAAAGPLAIHLLNRRRFKTVAWGAMEFLREAIERNRRFLHLRDLLLLVLRMLAMVLLGALLARPFYRGSDATGWWLVLASTAGSLALVIGLALAVLQRSALRRGAGGLLAIAGLAALLGTWQPWNSAASVASSAQEPVHAVVLIDNSRSMGATDSRGTMLAVAQQTALEFLQQLPVESRVTVIPLSGSPLPVTLDAYHSRDDARRAIEQISLVDVADHPRTAIQQAVTALERVRELPNQRVVWLSDFPQQHWKDAALREELASLPDVQLVPIVPGGSANVAITDFVLEDGLASIEAPARFVARIWAMADKTTGNSADLRSSDDAADATIFGEVKLLIDGTEVASQGVALAPGQTREIELLHQFHELSDPDVARYATAELVLTVDQPQADRLAADNRALRVVPVVAAVPVLFVDQYGSAEDLARHQIGETYALRHLLAPRSASEADPRALVKVVHFQPAELTVEALERVRLVVVAGIEQPADMVPLLKDYVVQGGRLVVLAGGGFDPVGWNQSAWLEGAGLLPAPLLPEALGVEPESAEGQLTPFFVSAESLQHDYFAIPGEDPEALAGLFGTTPFFKAVRIDLSNTVLSTLLAADEARLKEQRRLFDRLLQARQQASLAPENQTLTANAATTADRSAEVSSLAELEQAARKIEPVWWRYRPTGPLWDRTLPDELLARQQQPRLIGQYTTDHLPFGVERSLGAGKVLFFSSGVTSNWNLLRTSSAMYLFHRTFCQLIEETFPQRNLLAGQRIALPLEAPATGRLVAILPDGQRRPITPEPLSSLGASRAVLTTASGSVPSSAVSSDVSWGGSVGHGTGVLLGRALSAGLYRLRAENIEAEPAQSTLNSSPTQSEEESVRTETRHQNHADGETLGGPEPDDLTVAAVQADADESNLQYITAADLRSSLSTDQLRVLEPGSPILLEGATQRGRSIWKWLAWAALSCLLLEMLFLTGGPRFKEART